MADGHPQPVHRGADHPGALSPARNAPATAVGYSMPMVGNFLVKLKPHSDLSRDARVLERFAIPPSMQEAFQGDLVLMRGDQAELSRDPRVVYAVPDEPVQAFQVPDDLGPELWGMAKIQAPAAWDQTVGSKTGPIVAVVDSGIDYTHPDLAANMWTNPGEIPGDGLDNDGNGVVDDVHGLNAITGSGDPLDDEEHGTHCAGTIGAQGNNGQGVVGVQWNANLMGIKFLNHEGSGSTSNAIKGLLYAEANGARISSNSWGGGKLNQALYDVMASSSMLHVCAAGNDNQNNDVNPTYPGSFDLPNVVAVAATDKGDRRVGFSSYGQTTVDLAAPGLDIYSTKPGGEYHKLSGTSMAAPHVAGAAALLLAAHPELSNAEVKARLLRVDHVPELADKTVSGGRLNLANVLDDDSTAPAALADFGATSPGPGQVELRWTAPGDDGQAGQATVYHLNGARLAEAPAPGGTAELRALRVPLSGSERSYAYGLQATDNVGLSSPVAEAQVTVPAGRVALEDDCSTPSEGFVAAPGWRHQDGAWTTGPEYGPHSNTSLTTRSLDLTGLKAPVLQFDARVDTENEFDAVHLEGRSGGAWQPLARYDGHHDWTRHEVDLGRFRDQAVELRWRLTSDDGINFSGMTLDNVVVGSA